MTDKTWTERMKKKDDLSLVSTDEIIIFFAGLIVFLFLKTFSQIFIISVLIWYWFKIRYYEQLIIRKRSEIYNIQYDNAQGVIQTFADGKTAEDRKPMLHDLEHFEIKRKFLVDKFVVISLILLTISGIHG